MMLYYCALSQIKDSNHVYVWLYDVNNFNTSLFKLSQYIIM